ncbi:MgtC/SapB family protein [Scytonema sp. UIC 10036]|uniref:MgtC/SapB family protein n=1 Tax=Scytonema sp. UIC 10036 TaxID=2304196 RepID=UPI0012DA676A|nr:MgtC/SapB family protein [Scytonema sp. UIC 10036]MUG94712.1 MgtC/SapB family protein [Scytonema sp. UIC 10036]
MPTAYYVAPNDWLNLTFRLCLALLVGGIVGIERQLSNKPAGLRTHMLVSFGAALFSLIVLQFNVSPNAEPISRVIQGIAAGVGFIGAGEILRQSPHESTQTEIQGLTSAAAIWVSAALGIAAACGLWQFGLIGAFLCLLVLNVFKRFERQ